MLTGQAAQEPAEKQRRHRLSQRRRGIPTGEQVAMAALRQIVLEFHRKGREDGMGWLAERIEHDLKADPEGRRFTPFGIHARVEALFDRIIKQDRLRSY